MKCSLDIIGFYKLLKAFDQFLLFILVLPNMGLNIVKLTFDASLQII